MNKEREIMDALYEHVFNTNSYRSWDARGVIDRIKRLADDPFPPQRPKKNTYYWDGEKLVEWNGKFYSVK